MVDQATFESFKTTTLEEALGKGMWLQEPFRDSTNWFPDADEHSRLLLSERALRELARDGLIVIEHSRTGRSIPEREYDRMFASARWQRGEPDELYDDVKYRQTEKGRRIADR